jgi:hypothetical protein
VNPEPVIVTEAPVPPDVGVNELITGVSAKTGATIIMLASIVVITRIGIAFRSKDQNRFIFSS